MSQIYSGARKFFNLIHQYQYQTYQVEVVILFKHQILIINLHGNVYQLEGRINKQILGAEELRS